MRVDKHKLVTLADLRAMFDGEFEDRVRGLNVLGNVGDDTITIALTPRDHLGRLQLEDLLGDVMRELTDRSPEHIRFTVYVIPEAEESVAWFGRSHTF